MELYQKPTESLEKLLSSFQRRELSLSSSWKEKEEKVFLFPEDSQVELGDFKCKSAYFYGYTEKPEIVSKDSICLIGRDLYELSGPTSFGHIYLFLLDKGKEEKDQEYYRIFRNIEYRRYKVNPEGFRLKVNTNVLKEGARVSKEAVNQKISFSDIGVSFLNQFHKEKRVKAVTQIFITDPAFDYDALLTLSKESEEITLALDHILKKLKRDCRTCSFKEVCDEVEGRRQLHQQIK